MADLAAEARTVAGVAQSQQRNIWSAILRGARQRCPNCGRGHLFRAYLKPVEVCSECAEPFGHIRADDGPAWLTILITGHVVVGIALAVEMIAPLPLWLSAVVFSAAALLMSLALLPKAKGIFIGSIWATGATGTDEV
jgi:uncharacterized protein (DUF983 family)